MRPGIAAKLKKIKLIVLDVDGVLTDGGIIIGSDGTEYKFFNVKDGSGISLARHVGIKFAIISGRFSRVIGLRAKELKIEAVYQDVMVKAESYEELKKKFGFDDGEICFMGDEIIDIPVFKKCGFSAAPADAVHEVKKAADYVCKKNGGRGCVREVIDMILKTQGTWGRAVDRYLRHEKPGT
jgi:3-deoxy-D-manno-octulosonate 8-phosphate phosphatase (KDO 8-P phosphatase)